MTEETVQLEPIIAVYPTWQVVVGAGYDLGTILDAITKAMQVIRSVVLRPIPPE